jgi:NTE family protein
VARLWGKRKDRQTGGLELGGVALGPRPWLVLGGGGLRGLAHLGALRVLTDAGLDPAGVIGTSIGALVGANYCAGQSMDDMERIARSVKRDDIAQMPRRVLWVQSVRSPALYRGDVLKSYLARVLPRGGWEALTRRYQANAVELGTGRTEWFGIGARTDVSLVDAVYASSALPVFFPPCPLPGGAYLDGGVDDPLPIRRAADLGATGIVAVDVGAGETADWEAVVRRGMLAVHERTFAIMAGRRRREIVAGWSGPPLLYIRPKVDSFGTLAFQHVAEMIEAGRIAAEEALSAVRPSGGRGPSDPARSHGSKRRSSP